MTVGRAKSKAPVQSVRPRSLPATMGEALLLAGVTVAAFGTAVAMLPGGYNPFGPIKSLVLILGAALCAVGFVLTPQVAVSAIRRARTQRSTWSALGLVGMACVATATSMDASQSLVGHYPEYQGLLLLLLAAFVGFSAYSLGEKASAWETIGRVAVVVTIVVAVYATLQFAGVDPVSYQREFMVRRVRSTLGNASNLGVFLCLALPIVVARARAERGSWRWLAWAATASGAVMLAWSLSRGAWLGALMGALAWGLAESRAWKRASRVRIAALAVAAAVTAVVLLALLVPSAAGRLTALADPSAGTPGWRLEVWTATARLVAERPLLGFGPASFRYAFPPRRTASMLAGESGAQVLDDPHNLFASTAVSAGVVALALLLWLLGEACLAAWRSREDAAWPLAGPALLASLVAATVALQFHFATLDSAPLFAAVVGLALGRAPLAASVTARDERAGEAAASGRADRFARAIAAILALALAAGCVAAAGLALADRRLAIGYGLVGQSAPWPQARAEFSAARDLAPWEPAMVWALGRGATQWMSATQDAGSFADASQSMDVAGRLLPADPLVAAQSAEALVVGALLQGSRPTLERALLASEHATALDPQNGYRWETRGVALGALGETQQAIDALELAVEYAPDDAQAWENLARMYDRSGDAEEAARARAQAAAAKARQKQPN
jgi:O-antigen ligase